MNKFLLEELDHAGIKVVIPADSLVLDDTQWTETFEQECMLVEELQDWCDQFLASEWKVSLTYTDCHLEGIKVARARLALMSFADEQEKMHFQLAHG